MVSHKSVLIIIRLYDLLGSHSENNFPNSANPLDKH